MNAEMIHKIDGIILSLFLHYYNFENQISSSNAPVNSGRGLFPW